MSASDRTEAHPPCSRLFVTIGPQFTEEEVRESFSAFGQIDDIYIPLDKAKGECTKNLSGGVYEVTNLAQIQAQANEFYKRKRPTAPDVKS